MSYATSSWWIFRKAAALAGKLYVVGGSENRLFCYSEVQCSENDNWILVAPLNVARGSHRCCTIQDSIYAFGGYESERLQKVYLASKLFGGLSKDYRFWSQQFNSMWSLISEHFRFENWNANVLCIESHNNKKLSLSVNIKFHNWYWTQIRIHVLVLKCVFSITGFTSLVVSSKKKKSSHFQYIVSNISRNMVGSCGQRNEFYCGKSQWNCSVH